ncbi:hypothetical protein [Edaphovirga cremea]|uniref:hypothetical protein n=1 Tax=Edaphovirga cremea TaxID=2267246 RepID=UPI000DEF32F8|nr:hypothetical protein [Edaphovirga cremea]
MSNVSEKKGMPIFLDETSRSISDSLEEVEMDSWFPSNNAAQKLWRCLECLRDLDDLLVDSANQKNSTKRKRKLKIALTPLHSLVKSVDDLCNDIQSNKETRCLLDESKIKDVSEIQELFSRLLPHDHKADISTVRNKLSAHIDKNMHPSEAQKISSIITSNEFGRWLHICLHLVLDLTKLDIYHWSCKPPSDEYICFMQNEPFIVTIKVEGEGAPALVAINIANSSPRNVIPEIVQRLVSHSQWMFKKNQPRISSLKEDSLDDWNTFKKYSYIHEPN